MDDDQNANLYDTDFIAWAETQAEVLRANPGLSDQGVDLENLIEEVETLARQEFRAFEDSLRSSLSRLIRAAFDPDAGSARSALSEVTGHIREARYRGSPTALERLDHDRVWAEAWGEAESRLPEDALPDGPGPCPLALEGLLKRGFDLRATLERVRALPCECSGPDS
jgi:hypothetical protein